MNFLQLCKQVRSESGIAGNNTPSSTSNQIGLLGKVVGWVRDAWLDIQREYPNWKFLRKKVSKACTVAKSEYNLLTELQLTDLRQFESGLCFTFEVDGTARAPLVEIPYSTFVLKYPTIPSGRPSEFAIGPGYTLMLNRAPDKAYPIQFHYWMTGELLDDDDDVPSIPADFHETIVWWALVRYAVHEGAVQEKADWAKNYARCLRRLEMDQLEIPGRLQFIPLA